MRTTVRLDDGLLKEAKRFALEHGCTLTSLIEDGLREVIARKGPAMAARKVKLHTVSGDGLHAGVDLDDSASLLDGMDEEP